MTPQQHFWDTLMAWGLALGFLLAVALLIAAVAMICSPAGQRVIQNYQQHRQAVRRIRMRAQLTRKGTDPEYVKFLEQQEGK